MGGRPQSAQLGRWLRQCRPRPPPVGASDMVVRAKSSSRRCREPYSVDTCGSLGPAPARSGRPEVAGVAYVIASVITPSGDGLEAEGAPGFFTVTPHSLATWCPDHVCLFKK